MCRLGRKRPEVKNRTLDPHVFSNMCLSRYMVYGQNPGFNECIEDEPFVGQAGDTFTNEVGKHGFERSDFYITNILHCYTPGNRSPLPEELRACKPIVLMELRVIKPKLIITLGKFAFNTFCPGRNYKDSLGDICKTEMNGLKYSIFPIYHPSGLNLSSKERKKKFQDDISTLCKLVKALERRDNA